MRLWHTELIPVLPRQQLLGQWRELNSIYKKQDKHILINFVYEYSKDDLLFYSVLVIQEMRFRGYKIKLDNFQEYFKEYQQLLYKSISSPPFQNKMTDRYLKQCLYNLQEKYDCGGITQEEWDLIYEKFGNVLEVK